MGNILDGRREFVHSLCSIIFLISSTMSTFSHWVNYLLGCRTMKFTLPPRKDWFATTVGSTARWWQLHLELVFKWLEKIQSCYSIRIIDIMVGIIPHDVLSLNCLKYDRFSLQKNLSPLQLPFIWQSAIIQNIMDVFKILEFFTFFLHFVISFIDILF